MKTALAIAGSDSSGGAGIQADIKTMTMNGVYAMTAVTAITAQNTTGVSAVSAVSPELLAQQLDAVFQDIFPDAVKIGMMASAELINVTAEKLRHYSARNIVVDPVMISTSGSALLDKEAVHTLKTQIFPLALLVTPNIPEAEILSGISVRGRDSAETATIAVEAAKRISESYGCAVLLKGGHSVQAGSDASRSDDLLYMDGTAVWFSGERIANPNTHGTGCTLSSAIASNLAKGFDIIESVRRAKEYISLAIGSMLDLGKGNGPLNHAFDLTGRFSEHK